jgi:hypothetical protein
VSSCTNSPIALSQASAPLLPSRVQACPETPYRPSAKARSTASSSEILISINLVDILTDAVREPPHLDGRIPVPATRGRVIDSECAQSEQLLCTGIYAVPTQCGPGPHRRYGCVSFIRDEQARPLPGREMLCGPPPDAGSIGGET